MSSWIHRVAACYRMDMNHLLKHDLAHDQIDNLDIAPPTSLLTALSRRSGIGLDQLRCMSFSGWVPRLFDSLDNNIPAALEAYAFQLSVLLPRGRRRTRSLTKWCAWRTSKPIQRACPLCLSDPADQAVRLAWKLPLMLSCPLHGCWLESYWGLPGVHLGWENASTVPLAAAETITAMDRRTWQALTMGYVELPRKRIHADLWFRLLRTLLDELNTPISQCGSCGGNIRLVWERCGYPLRAGEYFWHPYEILNPAVQLQMLEAAACAIDLIESGVLSPPGEQAKLFLPEPKSESTNDLTTDSKLREPISCWQETVNMINETIDEARHDPATARSLFALASYGQRDPEQLQKLRITFATIQIPLEFLSHYESEQPFACH